MNTPRKTAFISSTSIDLPEHRNRVTQACLERDYFPDGMERWPAANADPETVCLNKVNQADLFIGIYAHRYGWVPPGRTQAITELEYDRAVALGIPRLLFVMGDQHPILAGDVETGPGAEKLKAFKARIQTERVRATFDNADQLRAEVLHALSESGRRADRTADSDGLRIDLTHLPKGAPRFLGRADELAALDDAWAAEGQTHILTLLAPGGVGKTSLVKHWLERLKADGWRGARRVLGWSFYSQGTGEDRQASEDGFLDFALRWFEVKVDPALASSDKGMELAKTVAATRTLLVLDGIEPLQYPPGPMAGELRAPGLQRLLTHLASAGQPGLCLITSRERLTDLAEWERNEASAAARRVDLGNLCAVDGARLLHCLDVQKAGAAAIAADDEELQTASREVRGHALTLTLLGRYLALAFDGDIRCRDQVNFADADRETSGGHTFKIMQAYEDWFTRAGADGSRELAALRLFGFFDRPASAEGLEALRAAPPIAGLTEALVDLSLPQWRATLLRLRRCRLLEAEADGSLDAHPLVREYLAHHLRQGQPEAWREGHRRLYEHLKTSAPYRPESLAGLQPLYQAINHGCLAGLAESALTEVYKDRILRGTGNNGFYSLKKLGAFSDDLGAVACFFVKPWSQPAPILGDEDQAWVLSEAGTRLRAVGRLQIALEPMRAGAEKREARFDWANAATSYTNLSELLVALGRVRAALADAENAVIYADKCPDLLKRIASLAALADALHCLGNREAADQRFREAEAMQAIRQSPYPLLYSLSGFRYCEFLLADSRRAAWGGTEDEAALQQCEVVSTRARQTLGWIEGRLSPLDEALNQLALAQATFYFARIKGEEIPLQAPTDIDRAVAGLHAAGAQHHLPNALLTRAWLRHCQGDAPAARADLAEVERIARRGNMRLHLADLHLTRARLVQHDLATARADLTQARNLIEECEYFRRLPELEDAEAVLGVAGTKAG